MTEPEKDTPAKIPEYLEGMAPFLHEATPEHLVYVKPPNSLFPNPFPLSEITRDFWIKVENVPPVVSTYSLDSLKNRYVPFDEYTKKITFTFKQSDGN